MAERPNWSAEEEEYAREVSRSIEGCFSVITRPNQHPWEVIQIAVSCLNTHRRGLAQIASNIEDQNQLETIEKIALGLYHYSGVNIPQDPAPSHSLSEIWKITHSES